MAVVQIDDKDQYIKVVSWLVRRGGSFRGLRNTIIVSTGHYNGLVADGLIKLETTTSDQRKRVT
ncbi:MAG: hypothetical protein WD972_00475 [Candidatus Andersenbacteria bacterium]